TPSPPSPTSFTLQNAYLQATINPETGDLTRLYDCVENRELLSAAANQLQAFHDQGQYWDAWNIAPDYLDHPLPPPQLTAIAWIEQGPLRQRLRVTRQLGQSTFVQDYVLDQQSPLLKIETLADWQETQVVLKVAFPLTVEAEVATYEMPFGAIARPTRPQTPADKAKWEVPALRWADLSDAAGGLSLLTDCKHGFDATPNQLRLTLLKAPLWPDPTSDRGQHKFTYALYPHAGGWQSASRLARELNLPLHCLVKPDLSDRGKLPTSQSFLKIKNPNLILSAFKQSEAYPGEFILRLYETWGEFGNLEIETTLPLEGLQPVDLLEQKMATGDRSLETDPTSVKPWQVCSYRLSRRFADNASRDL
ncbi:MAG: glycoside hydrolase family 38 C-terminal domain-containing protein, partial [Almyronema sp.]